MSENLIAFLQRVGSLTEQDISELYSYLETKKFNRGDQVTRIGERENYMYFIISGLVRKYFFRGKQEVITMIAKEGEMFGSAASFLSGQPSKYAIEAMEPVSAVAISKKNLEELYKKDKKWEKIGRIISVHYFIMAEMRYLDSIRFNMKERFAQLIYTKPDLLGRVPQKYLASFLNIKPETFSRLKKSLFEEKVTTTM